MYIHCQINFAYVSLYTNVIEALGVYMYVKVKQNATKSGSIHQITGLCMMLHFPKKKSTIL